MRERWMKKNCKFKVLMMLRPFSVNFAVFSMLMDGLMVLSSMFDDVLENRDEQPQFHS